MENPRKETVEISIDGRFGFISPPTVLVTMASGATYQDQLFSNPTGYPVTVVFPGGLSPQGCIFGIAGGQTLTIRISASAPRGVEIPFGVFVSDENVRDWAKAASPPTMIIEP